MTGVNDVFPEGQATKIGKTAMKILGMKDEEFYEGMGVYFVSLATELGYGLILSCLGRRFRDFFVNLDNLHDYLKFTFQRLVFVRGRHLKGKYWFFHQDESSVVFHCCGNRRWDDDGVPEQTQRLPVLRSGPD